MQKLKAAIYDLIKDMDEEEAKKMAQVIVTMSLSIKQAKVDGEELDNDMYKKLL